MDGSEVSDARSRAVAAARGHAGFDILIAGGTVIDVGTGELRSADVGLVGPIIASVHPAGSRRDAARVVDVSGKFVAPGFIDMHVHFESSMLTPGSYAETVVPRGTTTILADPHEIANVCGLPGMRYAIEASHGLPLRFLFQAPSCVPPVPGLELSGADFLGSDIATMLAWPDVASVGEVMDMRGVLERQSRMVDVVDAGLRSGKLVEGHAFGLAGGDLQGYLAAGIDSDHEITTAEDAMEKLHAGMTVELRGTFPDLLPLLVAELNKLPMMPTHLVICSDDVFAYALFDEGGIDDVMRRLIRAGLDPISAIRLATYNAAYRLRRTDLGFVGAGRRADLVILSDVSDLVVDEVYVDGRHVASGSAMIEPVVEGATISPTGTVKLDALSVEDFRLRLSVPDGVARVKVIAGPVITAWDETDLIVRDGVAELPPGYLLQAVIHRHGRGSSAPALAALSGWGRWTGAIATTVSHDTHNLVVFGREPRDMAAAANAVIAAGGGVAVARGGQVEAVIGLPIAGILSPLPPRDVAAAQRKVVAAAHEVAEFGFPLRYPIFQVMIASLVALPGPHLTDLGVVDGTTGERLSSILVSA